MLEGECGAWTRAQLQALAVEASTFQPTKQVYEELALPLTMTAPLFCPHSTAETLEQAAMVHGNDVDVLVDNLNAVYKAKA